MADLWAIAHLVKEIAECMTWVENARLVCCSRGLRDTLGGCSRFPLWWGQAQSTSRSEQGLLESFAKAAQDLRPAGRPNFAIIMIDTSVLLGTNSRILSGRLHAANLVPFDCPILFIDSHDGVFGATIGKEGGFSQYEDRDIELDPVAPITCVLTVAFVPPEEVHGVIGGAATKTAATTSSAPMPGGMRADAPGDVASAAAAAAVSKKEVPRVCCFLADGQAQSPPYASASFVDDWEGLPPVWMESVLPRDEMIAAAAEASAPTAAAAGAGKRCPSPAASSGERTAVRKTCYEQEQQNDMEDKSATESLEECSILKGSDVCSGRAYVSRTGKTLDSPRSISADRPQSSSTLDACPNGEHGGGSMDRLASGSTKGAGASCHSGLKRTSSESGINGCRSSSGDATCVAKIDIPSSEPRSCSGGEESVPCYAPRLRGGRYARRRPRSLSKLRQPSSTVPLKDADTILLLGTHLDMLDKTSAWLGHHLPNAVIMGGLSNCSLVVGDQVYSRNVLRRRSAFGTIKPLVVGVALKGVRALAVSAKGFGGVGPVFRVDHTIDGPSGNVQAGPGKILREVIAMSDGGSTRSTTAGAIFYDEVLNSPAWSENAMTDHQTVFLGVGWSPEELVCCRGSRGDSSSSSLSSTEGSLSSGTGGLCVEEEREREREREMRTEEATGLPPVSVNSVMGQLISLQDDVIPGQYARYMRTQAELSLADTEAAFLSCKRRIEREAGIALSSVHFTCAARPDRLEALCWPRESGAPGQDEPHMQARGNAPGAAGRQEPTIRVMALHQQEVVRFCKTMNAPAAGLFCQGELGPLPTLVGGILPSACRSRLQAFSTCTAVLYWKP